MSQTITEFVCFRVKSSVRPEDADNDEGQALLNLFRSTKQQSGHQSSAWGRVVEDEQILVWVLEWSDARGSIAVGHLHPFLADAPQHPTAIYATLNPPLSATSTLTSNPTTEICALPFPSTMSVPETKQLNADLINFRTAVVEQLPPESGPRSWAMGHIDRPSLLPHAKSPSGEAFVHLLVVGWDSVEAHKKAKESAQFVSGIAPIREKMLPPVPGLEMKHVSFQAI
ncbi:hypothetical protein N7492_005775 [Penicillium capsulatum]|uniref:ABM domain-containing protein n=1 Tax=Penicillium capsulatum TaxID=69766 RepID=A0A9W9IDZ8_9EURO|nr:hypothetical protein N7492_005775 [Penicillium capsulatum]KAJ6135126.1 hypothetical protein N7512_000286 [Penicillium capsulatum]